MKEELFSFKIVTPKGIAYQEEVEFVKAPGMSGEVGILADHSPAIIELNEGDVVITKNNLKESFTIQEGLLYIMPQTALLLCGNCINNNI
ncbi:F0F1 ATP synthase subunit epsilon [bacterium]|jgi:F-type H+-transporting ATPase subunit epsilon|nr:F0F1 ATP synthase subunit epsilon [bacterium]MBT3580844.1 F0F1 ATP synthase subunit epsilon [bacterium]MBT4552410.1 F0F1 ATP synthase subunit epsilon [bacterium]MBT5989080.1 F0F1 ATP synthase subunit epsilon [bacterium]MBT7088051.1 F0F1 ATP synthase subunit epsilon [bacterium]